MRIPESVKVGGYNVLVQTTNDMILKAGHLGEYQPLDQVIQIDHRCTVQQSEETFIHELLESIISIYDITLKHNILNLLATILHQVIKDNPDLFCCNNEIQNDVELEV